MPKQPGQETIGKTCVQSAYYLCRTAVQKAYIFVALCKDYGFYLFKSPLTPRSIHTKKVSLTTAIFELLHTIHMAYKALKNFKLKLLLLSPVENFS